MKMTIDDIKHCLKVMVDCEVCEECNLYGTTGTDHCEHDCVVGALDIINKYQKIEQILDDCLLDDWEILKSIREVLEDGKID
jgi:hypothetical protein